MQKTSPTVNTQTYDKPLVWKYFLALGLYLLVTGLVGLTAYAKSSSGIGWAGLASLTAVFSLISLWEAYAEKNSWYVLIAAGFVVGADALVYVHLFSIFYWLAFPIQAVILWRLWRIARLREIYQAAFGMAKNGPPGSPTPANAEEDAITFEAVAAKLDFDRLYGMAELKVKLKQASADITKGASAGATSNARNGILLFGAPGNGKTAIAEALAGELGLPIISVAFGDVANVYVNATTQTVKKAFRDAVRQAPCVLFLDEIDSLLSDRSKAFQSDSESQKTTNAILTELVNIRNKGVVVVGATNFLERLDRAAIREGRFDFKIEVTPPDLPARFGLLRDAIAKHCGGAAVDEDACQRAAARWEGYSVARIKGVAEELGSTRRNDAFDKADFSRIMAALRQVQGRKGKIPATTKSLDEMILPDNLRSQMRTIAARMRDIERVEKMGGTVPTGLLFFGDPGTGKTEAARCLAKESGWAFLSTSGNSLIRDVDLIDKIAAEAADIRPCIVFIDEADDILGSRDMSNFVTVANKLLSVIDGADGKVKDIVYIAATNHPERIDPAFLRGGRFTEKMQFELPNHEGLAHFIDTWVKSSKAKFEADLAPAYIAELLGEGTSIANAAAILQESVNRMIGRSDTDTAVTERDILDAVKTIRP